MAIAPTVEQHLIKNRCAYAVLNHVSEPLHADQVQGTGAVVRALILRDSLGFLMTIIPSGGELDLDALRDRLNRDLSLASDDAVANLFPDCQPGAIPAVGSAYGIETWLDDGLLEMSDIYFDAGDRQTLVHIAMDQYLALLGPVHRSPLVY